MALLVALNTPNASGSVPSKTFTIFLVLGIIEIILTFGLNYYI
jgi:hypothetical protein